MSATMTRTRQCPRCGDVLPADREHFARAKTATLGICRPCARKQWRREHRNRRRIGARFPTPRDGTRVDIEPFAAWMETTFRDWSIPEIAEELGIPERRVTLIRSRGQKRLTLAFIDQALTAGYGRPDILNDLYPDE